MRIVRKAHDNPETLLFHIRTEEDTWGRVEELAVNSHPSAASQHLRAFYAVELMYHKALPMVMWSAGNKEMHQEFSNLRFERSLLGLEQLEEKLQHAKRHIGARRTVMAVKRSKSNNSQQVVALLDRPSTILQNCQQSVEILRRCLRRDEVKGLTRLGELLGDSLLKLSEDPTVVSGYLSSILQITPDNSASPWQIKFLD